MLPLSSEGTRSASRPTNARVFASEVTRPWEWCSLADIHPPAPVVVPAIAKACTVLVMPTVSDLGACDGGDGCPSPDVRLVGLVAGAHAPTSRVMAARRASPTLLSFRRPTFLSFRR